MRHVEPRASFFQAPVVEVRAVGFSVRIGFIHSLREGVKRGQGQACGVPLLQLERTGMVSRVAKVTPQINAAEVRVRAVALIVGEDRVQGGLVVRDVEGNLVDIPGIQKTDPCRTLVAEFGKPGGPELILQRGVPIHGVRVAQVGIAPGCVAGTIVDPDEGRSAIGQDVEVDLPRSLAGEEGRARIARGALHADTAGVFVEELGQVGGEQIDGRDAEAAAKDHRVIHLVGHAHARLEVLPMPIIELARGVRDGPFHTRKRIDRTGIEFALLAVLGRERALIRPAHAQIEGESAGHVPVVLEVERRDSTIAAANSRACWRNPRARRSPAGTPQNRCRCLA